MRNGVLFQSNLDLCGPDDWSFMKHCMKNKTATNVNLDSIEVKYSS